MDTRSLALGFELTHVTPQFIDDPYPTYAALREHDPVHRFADGGVFLSRYEDVIAVYRDPRATSDKRAEFLPKFGATPLYEHHTSSLVFNDPPLHTRVRRLIMGALNQRAIARMEAGVTSLVDGLLERMAGETQGGRTFDLIEGFAAQIPVEVIGNLLEVPRAERGPLREWSLAILSGLEPAPSAEVLARGNRAVVEFLAFLRDLVAARRKHPGDAETDVLTRLIQGEADGERLSEAELLHNCIFLLNAGHETTTNLIGNGVWLLLTHPVEFARLREDPGLLPAAVEEMLRYDGSIQLNNRRLSAAMQVGRHELSAGTSITIGIGAANRDPAQFPAPERFDIGRKPNRHVAFGQGEHACAGMNVARLEARIAIGRLAARFPHLSLAGAPVRDRRVRFRGFRMLPVGLAG